ncbi:PAS domain-containing protein [Streptomyces sp. NPDC059161]|uniref:PAS domain-containing protein n=1 Tax=Streptomyces sp. NPDC059161 TaxID=3346749 RepID=UPI00369B67E1
MDLAPAAAFIRDSEGRYLWANHAYAHLYGTVPDGLVGKYIEDFDAPAEAVQFRALDQEILSGGCLYVLRQGLPDTDPHRHQLSGEDLGWPTVRPHQQDAHRNDHAQTDEREPADECGGAAGHQIVEPVLQAPPVRRDVPHHAPSPMATRAPRRRPPRRSRQRGPAEGSAETGLPDPEV